MREIGKKIRDMKAYRPAQGASDVICMNVYD